MDKVFAPGDKVRVEIEGVAFGGRGVGRIDGRVVFVPFTADGDVVEAEVKVVKKKYLLADIQELVHPSPFRTLPRCLYYTVCGGCHYQHIDYAHELQIKKRQIIDAFERIGGLSSFPIEDVVPSPKMFQYRQKAEYHRAQGKKGRIMTGFIGVDGNRIIDIDRCELVDESINEEYGRVRKYEMPGGVSEARMIFWSGVEYKADEYITRRVKDKTLVVPYKGFFQANAVLVEQLVNAVVEACHPLHGTTILDCYCGSGLFSLFLASGAQRVLGCDINGAAVQCAERNLEENGFLNALFYAGRMERVLKKLPGKVSYPIDTVILDPPRTGCTADVFDGIDALNPKKIVYVSCDPTTQARDIRRLAGCGYVINSVQPFDMFPRTKHVEILAVLNR